jgi:Holliday junction resolvasome RuvABC endonuclease subunit
LIGVDYSLTSPAISILPDDTAARFEQAHIHFLTSVKKAAKLRTAQLTGYEFPQYTSFQDRIGKISQWAIHVIREAGSPLVFLEGYSFASVGNSFDIAENTGLLKHKLHLLGIEVRLVPPTSLKKFATDKGNAKKCAMAAAFWEENSVDIKKELGLTSENPSSDIVDAYYLARYGVRQMAMASDVLQQITT